MVQVRKAKGPGHQPLPAYVIVGLPEVGKQVQPGRVTGGKTGVAAFGGNGNVTGAVPEQNALAEARPGRDQGRIAQAGCASLELVKIRRRQQGNPVAVGFKVVDDKGRAVKKLTQFIGTDAPGQVSDPAHAIEDGAGRTNAGGLAAQRPPAKKMTAAWPAGR